MTTHLYWYNSAWEPRTKDAKNLYNAFREKEMLRALFWQCTEDISEEGFVWMFSDPCRRMLFLIYEEGRLAGGIWIDSLQPGHSCIASMGILPEFRGRTSVEAARLALETIQHDLDYPNVWSITPHFAACALMQKVGMERMAELPGFALIDGKPQNVFVYRKER